MDMTEPRNRLQEIREAAGISRAGLAAELDLGEIQVRRWEEHKLLIPSKWIGPLTARFDVSSDHLLGLDRVTEKAA